MIDPEGGVDGIFDIATANGRIVAIEETLNENLGEHIYDASGKLVTPGLVDLHIHGYHLATPLGIDVDHYCLGRGVTTAVDAGSAGCDTFPGYRAFAADRFDTRLLAFLHISRAGLSFAGPAGGVSLGELESLKLVNFDDCIACIEANRDLLVGVKVRLSDTIADEGRNESEAYRLAQEAASATGLPLMVHHSFSTVPLDACPGKMVSGDIYTHAFHGHRSTIVDPVTRRVLPAVRTAREDGVLFDIGHGMGSFNWTVGEICLAEGFSPDTISTDLHSLTCEGPAYDLPTVMTRLLHLGMPLPEVIRCSTIAPAKAIGWANRIGTLGLGREADIAVLELESTENLELEDCNGQWRKIAQRLVARSVWRSGEPGLMTQPNCSFGCREVDAARDPPSRGVVYDEPDPHASPV